MREDGSLFDDDDDDDADDIPAGVAEQAPRRHHHHHHADNIPLLTPPSLINITPSLPDAAAEALRSHHPPEAHPTPGQQQQHPEDRLHPPATPPTSPSLHSDGGSSGCSRTPPSSPGGSSAVSGCSTASSASGCSGAAAFRLTVSRQRDHLTCCLSPRGASGGGSGGSGGSPAAVCTPGAAFFAKLSQMRCGEAAGGGAGATPAATLSANVYERVLTQGRCIRAAAAGRGGGGAASPGRPTTPPAARPMQGPLGGVSPLSAKPGAGGCGGAVVGDPPSPAAVAALPPPPPPQPQQQQQSRVGAAAETPLAVAGGGGAPRPSGRRGGEAPQRRRQQGLATPLLAGLPAKGVPLVPQPRQKVRQQQQQQGKPSSTAYSKARAVPLAIPRLPVSGGGARSSSRVKPRPAAPPAADPPQTPPGGVGRCGGGGSSSSSSSGVSPAPCQPAGAPTRPPAVAAGTAPGAGTPQQRKRRRLSVRPLSEALFEVERAPAAPAAPAAPPPPPPPAPAAAPPSPQPLRPTPAPAPAAATASAASLCRRGGTPAPLSANLFSGAPQQQQPPQPQPPSPPPPSRGDGRDASSIECWGLPEGVAERYAAQGITTLFPWQRACLEDTGVLHGGSLVYCAPTSGGKTLVAEMALAKRLGGCARKRKALFVVPYVAMAAEKAPVLQHLLEPMGLIVSAQAGGKGSHLLLDDVSVCTFERANSLINTALEMGRISEIAIVVIDELHHISEPERGGTLEMLLTKLLFAQQGSPPPPPADAEGAAVAPCGLQVIGMSATLPNAPLLASWLGDAWFFATDYRPLPLTEGYCVAGCLKTYPEGLALAGSFGGGSVAPASTRQVSPFDTADRDCLVALARETLRDGGSVLIFCATKRAVEATAARLAASFEATPAWTPTEGQVEGRSAAAEMLRSNPCGPDPALERAISVGTAYHHAGMTVEEREVVERCFRDTAVRALCCTTTLAAGVNLPARRVILLGVKVGIQTMDASRYKQAAGRAGRAGLDPFGESIVISRKGDELLTASLITGPLPQASSTFSREKRGMVRALGEAISSGIVRTTCDVERYSRCTFLYHQCVAAGGGGGEDAIASAAKLALEFLEEHEFVAWHTDGGGYFTPSHLAQATFKSGLSPHEAKLVSESLEQARQHFVMSHELHLVYHCTPYASGVEPRWDIYSNIFTNKGPDIHHIARVVGVNEGALSLAQLRGGTPDCSDRDLLTLRRFYAAMMLYDLVCEVPLAKVVSRYATPRGSVQRLMENAASFSGMVSQFADSLNWWGFPSMIQKLQLRLKDGVENDIVALMQIPSMKPYRARALYQHGYRTLACIAAGDPASFDEILSSSHPYVKKGVLKSWVPKQQANARHGNTAGQALVRDAKVLLLQNASEVRESYEEAINACSRANAAAGEATPATTTTAAAATPAAPPAKRQRVGECYGATSKSKLYGLAPGAEAALFKTNPAPAPPPPPPPPSSSTAAAAAGGMQRGNSKGLYFQPPVSAAAPAGASAVARGGAGVLQGMTVRALAEERRSAPQVRRLQPAAETNRGGALAESSGLPQGPVAFTVVHLPCCEEPDDGERRFSAALRSQRGCGVEISLGGGGAGGVAPTLFLCVAFDGHTVFHFEVPCPGGGAPFSQACFERRRRVAEDLLLYNPQIIKDCYAVKDFFKSLCRCLPPLGACPPPPQPQQQQQQHQQTPHGGLAWGGGSFLQRVAEGYADPRVAAWLVCPDEAFEGGPHHTVEVLAKKVLRNVHVVSPAGCPVGCRRAVLSHLMMRQLRGQLKHMSLEAPFARIEMPFAAMLAVMECNGMQFDTQVYQAYSGEMSAKAELLSKRACEMTGTRWSLTSPADCARALFDNQKLPEVGVRQIRPAEGGAGQAPAKRKRAESRSTSAAVLARLGELRPDHPLPSMIREHRMLVGWLAKYIAPIPAFASRGGDGRVRADFQQTVTNTGRIAAVDPSLQTIPHPVEFCTTSGDLLRLELRRAFVGSPPLPSRGGGGAASRIVVADYSQVEVRIMAHFSQDPAMVGFLSAGGDVFRRIASKVFSKPADAVLASERKVAKALCYGILYGKGATSLSEDLQCSKEEASGFLHDFKQTYSGVTSYIGSVIAFCKEHGYVETLMGRRRFLPTIFSKNQRERAFAERQAVNTVCQGSAADIVKIAMLRLQQTLPPPCLLVLQVHDELVFDIPPHLVQPALKQIREVMEQVVQLSVPLPVKLQTGPSWGDLQTVDL